jgi:hypothetical protein
MKQTVLPVSKEPTHLFEGQDFMIVKAVEVEQLSNTVQITEKVNSQVSVIKNEDYLQKLS